MSDLHQIFMHVTYVLYLGPPLAALRYVTYFRFFIILLSFARVLSSTRISGWYPGSGLAGIEAGIRVLCSAAFSP